MKQTVLRKKLSAVENVLKHGYYSHINADDDVALMTRKGHWLVQKNWRLELWTGEMTVGRTVWSASSRFR